MRIDRFQSFAIEAYRQAPEVTEAQPWSDGTKRPYGVEVRLANGRTVRHALTMVTPPGEDVAEPEQIVEGEPAPPIEPRPQPGGVRDRQTAAFLASALANAGNRELARVYVYDENSTHAGLGTEGHNGTKVHMLLV